MLLILVRIPVFLTTGLHCPDHEVLLISINPYLKPPVLRLVHVPKHLLSSSYPVG